MFIILLIIFNFKQYSVSWRRLLAASYRQLSFSTAKKTRHGEVSSSIQVMFLWTIWFYIYSAPFAPEDAD